MFPCLNQSKDNLDFWWEIKEKVEGQKAQVVAQVTKIEELTLTTHHKYHKLSEIQT